MRVFDERTAMHRPMFELHNSDYCISQLVPSMMPRHTDQQTPPTEHKQQDTFMSSPQVLENIRKLTEMRQGNDPWQEHLGLLVPAETPEHDATRIDSPPTLSVGRTIRAQALQGSGAHMPPHQASREHANSSFSIDSAVSPPLSEGMLPQPGSVEEQMMLKAVYEEIVATQPERRRPPPGYHCHVCNSTEHYIKDCPERKNTEQPGVYQGSRQSVGKFKCPTCRKEWLSKRCFANCEQRCRKCRQAVRPHKMYSMEKAVELGLISLAEARETELSSTEHPCDYFLYG